MSNPILDSDSKYILSLIQINYDHSWIEKGPKHIGVALGGDM